MSQELDAFFSEILTPPTEKQEAEGINVPKAELSVNVENSTDEFIREEVLSPSRVWHKVFDDNSGQYYYFNEKLRRRSGTSQTLRLLKYGRCRRTRNSTPSLQGGKVFF